MASNQGRYFEHLPRESAKTCGCDPGIGWMCDKHRPAAMPTSINQQEQNNYGPIEQNFKYDEPHTQKAINIPQIQKVPQEGIGGLPWPSGRPEQPALGLQGKVAGTQAKDGREQQLTLFPGSDADRKSHPVWDGVVMYFPRAMREISYVSFKGNEQHNPGQKLHWVKGKSTDQSNTAMRHRMDHGVGNYRDTDGTYHMAKVCWRDLAEFETFLEQQEKL